ncbi:hypothetical protein ABZ079_35530 [Streptomyces sp. NPDC006314]|uniref:hypothetical protein n=1 Tax=Streptomyces sp. NPDC006314 TaxID=3154475 RepID=UPI0033A06201
MYGLYQTGAADGRQNLAGFVFAEVLFAPGQTKVPAALLWHGSVITAKLPVAVTQQAVIVARCHVELFASERFGTTAGPAGSGGPG